MDRYSLQGLMNEYSQRISEDPDWGVEIANILIKEKEFSNELWKSVFTGLQDTISEEKDWERLFDILLKLDELKFLKNEISTLLKNRIEDEDNQVPDSLLKKADNIAQRLIDELIDEKVKINTDLDWLTIAINKPAGKLSEYYLIKINREIKKTDGRLLRDYYKKIFNRIISKDSDFARLFVVVLISQIHFLSNLDYEWTKEKLIPRLNSENKDELMQAWNGFLVWGKWNAHILDDLLPAYKKFYKHVNSLDRRLQERFCDHIASICVLSPTDPFEEKLLIEFIKFTDKEVRAFFSQKLKDYLKRTNEEIHEKIWNEWLKKYLEKRCEDVPAAFSDQEIENLLYLIIYMEGIIKPLSKYIIKLDFPDLDHYFFFTELNESSIPKGYPEIAAKFVNKLLNATQQPFWDSDEVVSIVDKLLKSNSTDITNELFGICHSLSRLGYSKASELKEKIEAIN